MFRAYLDESGHEGKNWMYLAGFLGHENQWRDFVPKWEGALGPQRKSLHMTNLRWNKDSTRRLLDRLGPIPEECGLTPVLGGVRYGDYEDLVSGSPEEKSLRGYMTCLFPLVLQALRVVPEDERLEIVFEEQRQYARFANTILALLSHPVLATWPWSRTTDGKMKLAKWSFVPKGSTIMTDPADYFAFALREFAMNKDSKKAAWCASILKAGEGIGHVYTRKGIRDQIVKTYEFAINEQLEVLRMFSQKFVYSP